MIILKRHFNKMTFRCYTNFFINNSKFLLLKVIFFSNTYAKNICYKKAKDFIKIKKVIKVVRVKKIVHITKIV